MTTGHAVFRRLAHWAAYGYPPSWRDRYGEELHALIDDTPGYPRNVLSLCRGAIGAWVRPQPHLFDQASRVRTSLGTILIAWTMLAGLGLLFGQLTEDQGLHSLTPGHPTTEIWYRIYVICAHASVAVVLIAGAPLWARMTLKIVRNRRVRDVALVAAPAIAPIAFLAALVTIARIVDHSSGNNSGDGIGHGWFLALTLIGFVAAATAAGGPALALHRLAPTGAALHIARYGAVLALATMLTAAAASIIDGVDLALWSPTDYSVFHATWPLATYTLLIMLAAATATVSAIRSRKTSHRQPSLNPQDQP